MVDIRRLKYLEIISLLKGNHFFGDEIGPDPNEFPNNVFSNKLPVGTKTVLHPNRYDPRRIDVIVYNWNKNDYVSVNLDNMIESGSNFTVHSVFDIWGEPVLKGKYQGSPLQLPMGTKPPPQPRGFPDAIAGDDIPGKTFEVFIVRSVGDQSSSVKNDLIANRNNQAFSVKLIRNTILKITNHGSPVTDGIEFTIHSLSGRVIAHRKTGSLPVRKSYEYQIPANIKNGMYICTLRAGDMVYSRPFTLGIIHQ